MKIFVGSSNLDSWCNIKIRSLTTKSKNGLTSSNNYIRCNLNAESFISLYQCSWRSRQARRKGCSMCWLWFILYTVNNAYSLVKKQLHLLRTMSDVCESCHVFLVFHEQSLCSLYRLFRISALFFFTKMPVQQIYKKQVIIIIISTFFTYVYVKTV